VPEIKIFTLRVKERREIMNFWLPYTMLPMQDLWPQCPAMKAIFIES